MCTALFEGLLGKVAITLGQHVEEDDRRRALRGELAHTRFRRMQAQLKLVEIKALVPHDDDLAVQNTAARDCFAQRFEQLGEIAVERLFIAALNKDFIVVTKDERAEA